MRADSGRTKANGSQGDVDTAARGRLLRASEVQDRLGVGRSTVYEWMASGELPVVRLGPRLRRVSEAGLQRWIEERTSALGAAA